MAAGHLVSADPARRVGPWRKELLVAAGSKKSLFKSLRAKGAGDQKATVASPGPPPGLARGARWSRGPAWALDRADRWS